LPAQEHGFNPATVGVPIALAVTPNMNVNRVRLLPADYPVYYSGTVRPIDNGEIPSGSVRPSTLTRNASIGHQTSAHIRRRQV